MPAEPEKPNVSGITKANAEEKPIQSTPSNAESVSIANKGKKLRNRKSFSINSILSGEEQNQKVSEEEEEDETAIKPGLPTDDFTENHLQNLWKEFLGDLKKTGKQRIYSGLNQAPIRLGENFTLIIELHSAMQQSCFDEEKRSIIKYLREKLNNFSIQFEVKMVKNAAKLEPYSPQEKFEYMAKKNPALLELRKKMNLDLE